MLPHFLLLLLQIEITADKLSNIFFWPSKYSLDVHPYLLKQCEILNLDVYSGMFTLDLKFKGTVNIKPVY